MRSRNVTITSGLFAAALGLALGVAPTSASAASDGALTFYSGAFTGSTVSYPDPGPSCTVLPFVAHAELNLSDSTILVYRTKDCSGSPLTFPANDIHSFLGFDAASFRTAG